MPKSPIHTGPIHLGVTTIIRYTIDDAEHARQAGFMPLFSNASSIGTGAHRADVCRQGCCKRSEDGEGGEGIQYCRLVHLFLHLTSLEI